MLGKISGGRISISGTIAAVLDHLVDAPFAMLELELVDRPPVVRGERMLRVRALVHRLAVQEERVRGVRGVFLDLQPVAVVHREHLDLALAVLAHQHVPARQQRRARRTGPCRRTAARPASAPGTSLSRISSLKRARLGLERLLQALAVGVVLPAVVAAAHAALLDEAVVQRGAAVLAVFLDAAERPWPSRNTSRSSPRIRTRFFGFSAVISPAGHSGCQ